MEVKYDIPIQTAEEMHERATFSFYTVFILCDENRKSRRKNYKLEINRMLLYERILRSHSEGVVLT